MHILFVRSESLSTTHTQGRGIRLHLLKGGLSNNLWTYFNKFLHNWERAWAIPLTWWKCSHFIWIVLIQMGKNTSSHTGVCLLVSLDWTECLRFVDLMYVKPPKIFNSFKICWYSHTVAMFRLSSLISIFCY